jgi:hypothetical protein
LNTLTRLAADHRKAKARARLETCGQNTTVQLLFDIMTPLRAGHHCKKSLKSNIKTLKSTRGEQKDQRDWRNTTFKPGDFSQPK